MIESVGRLPGDFRVALLAAASGELIGVRVVSPVTDQAVGAQAQQGPIERSMFLLEHADVRRGDELWQVAVSTRDFGMLRRQLEPGTRMIEACRIQFDDRHVPAAVFSVTACTGSLADCGVISLSFGETSPQRLVTLQAFAVGGTRRLELVAAGTLEKPLEVLV
jgi:hypothetical protein